jgi:predicted dehydrogenase
MEKLACIDYKSASTADFQKKYGFRFGFLTPDSSIPLVKKVENPVVIIATYHSDHSSLAYQIYKANPKSIIFIEKPPTVTLNDLVKLIELFNSNAKLEIGFNRRFIEFSRYVKDRVQDKRLIVTCSIKEVVINQNHWYLWKNQGTRITGNVVHWFDLANWWVQSKPLEINVIADPSDPESSAISVIYENGSILNVTASDKGNSVRGVQEKIEVRFDNETIFIDDFTSLTHLQANGVKSTKRKFLRDKGHNAMYRNFLKIIQGEEVSKYSSTELINTAIVTYYASHMALNNIRTMNIEKEIDKYSSMLVGKRDLCY